MSAPALILEAAVRLTLAGAFSPSPYAREQAWCGTAAVVTRDTLSLVAVRPAVVRWATPLGVAFTCPPGAVMVHSHTGARCDVLGWYCALDTPLPCAVSAEDRRALVADHAPAGVVVCRDGTALAYTPDEETP